MMETVASSVGDFPRPHPLTSLALDAVTSSVEVEWEKYPSASMHVPGLAKQHVCFAKWHQWKWYGLIKSEMLWFLLWIAPLIPSFGNVTEVGGVPKFLLNTASWWLKPLHTFCTGHIFEKSSLWNWISLTWASLGYSFHTVSNWILNTLVQVCDIVEPLEMLV